MARRLAAHQYLHRLRHALPRARLRRAARRAARGGRVLFIPYALKDRDGYAAKARAAFEEIGFGLDSLHEAAGPPAGDRGGRGGLLRGRQHLPPARRALRAGRAVADPSPRGGGHALRRRQRGLEPRLPDDHDHERHADRRAAVVRGARRSCLPDQPALPRPGARLDAHGRDARDAHPRVPRGERPRSWACARGRSCASRATRSSCAAAPARASSGPGRSRSRCCRSRRSARWSNSRAAVSGLAARAGGALRTSLAPASARAATTLRRPRS